MITKDNNTASESRATGFAIALILGVAVGVAAGGSFFGGTSAPRPDKQAAGDDPATATRGPFRGESVPAPPEDLGPAFELEFSSEAAATLEVARQRALDEGVIRQLPGDEVRVTVRVGEQRASGIARLKGDWLDHVETDKWSLRIQLDDGHIFGMSELSIQHPKTRGYFTEWLALEIGRREGLLAPRCRFVDVVINGNRSGIYYLEEHFTKEMLESQGRRDGPIVRLLEDSLWTTWRQFGYSELGDSIPRLLGFAQLSFSTDAAAYDEGRLAKVEELNDRLHASIRKVRDLQAIMLRDLENEPDTLLPVRIRQMDAMHALQGRTIDDVFVADRFGRWLAHATLFRSVHGLSWHQLRFYHDPILDRIEPILFDTGSTMDGEFGDLVMTHIALEHYMRSPRCRHEAFRALGRFTQRATLDGWLRELEAPMRAYAAVMAREGILPDGMTVDSVLERMRAHQDHLRAIVTPEDPANFTCQLIEDDAGDAFLEVDAWPTTSIPVVIERFRFGNGREVPAQDALVSKFGQVEPGRTHVVLSSPGRRARFRFRADQRLLQLRDVQAIKQAIREQALGRDRNVKLEVAVDFGWLHLEERQETEKLRIRRASVRLDGRPAAPSLDEALRAHTFLVHDVEYNTLRVKPGTWDVDGDLILPRGYGLEIPPDVRLRFAPDAVFASFSHPVSVGGAPEHEVVFEPQSAEAGWAGLVIADTGTQESVWSHAIVRGAERIVRGSWQTSGGVTFYRAPVKMQFVRIEGARGEDALNVFAAPIDLLGCTIDGGPSDLFDGDFIRGTVRGCTFQNAGEDGVDFSGSQVTIEACRFIRLGDKAISVGEKTRADVRNCIVESASIGVAAKDLSTVTIEGLQLGVLENYGIAAFIKKSEFGASTVTATGVSAGGSFGRGRYLAQTGCVVEVDGVVVPTEDLDVKALYDQKVLGK